MSFKKILNIVTVLLIAIILFLAREELVQAWHLLFKVNLWILALLIPLQLLSFYAVGEMIFSYLNQKGTLNAKQTDMAKMALELNFVNHILPSGGVSGASYMTWRLKHFGVSAGRATIAQVVRFVASFAAFFVLLVIALIAITLDGGITRGTILITSSLGSAIVFGVIGIIYLFDDERRINGFVGWIAKVVNKILSFFRPKHAGPFFKQSDLHAFFIELREDYVMLRKEPRLLIKPFLWGLLFNVAEIAMFFSAFWALGSPINPAPLLIAYGLATIAGMVFVTPGGAGGYELLMIGFLTSAGINPSVSVAAVVLTRTILIFGTIVTGYFFYHKALSRYGKETLPEDAA